MYDDCHLVADACGRQLRSIASQTCYDADMHHLWR